MLQRVSAVIIRNKKILLVTGHNSKAHWTPGGGVEENESLEEALKREIKEELNAEVKSSKDYLNYDSEHLMSHKPIRIYCYIVEINGTVKPQKEITSIKWCSKEDIKKRRVIITAGIKDILIPQLIEDNLL